MRSNVYITRVQAYVPNLSSFFLRDKIDFEDLSNWYVITQEMFTELLKKVDLLIRTVFPFHKLIADPCVVVARAHLSVEN